MNLRIYLWHTFFLKLLVILVDKNQSCYLHFQNTENKNKIEQNLFFSHTENLIYVGLIQTRVRRQSDSGRHGFAKFFHEILT